MRLGLTGRLCFTQHATHVADGVHFNETTFAKEPCPLAVVCLRSRSCSGMPCILEGMFNRTAAAPEAAPLPALGSAYRRWRGEAGGDAAAFGTAATAGVAIDDDGCGFDADADDEDTAAVGFSCGGCGASDVCCSFCFNTKSNSSISSL